jgi:hypothetical protein
MQKVEIDAVIAAARKSREFMHSALRVGLAFGELRNAVIRDFADELNLALSDGVRVVDVQAWRDRPSASYSGFTVRHPGWPAGLEVAVEAQSGGVNDYILGVVARNRAKRNNEPPFFSEEFRNAISKATTTRLGGGSSSDGWAWYQYVDKEWRSFSTATALDALVEKNQLINYLVTKITMMEEAIAEVLAVGVAP